MLKRIALICGLLVALCAAPSAYAACPATASGTISGSNAIALQATQEAACADLDALAAGKSFGVPVIITRPADTAAYTANDVVGPATGSTAAQTFMLGAAAGEYRITGAKLQINATALIAGETNYLLDCYSVTPPSALGDNAAFDIPAGDQASHLGEINLGTPIDRGSTLTVETDFVGKQWTFASANIFCYLVTAGAYTPTASRVYVVTLHSVAAY